MPTKKLKVLVLSATVALATAAGLGPGAIAAPADRDRDGRSDGGTRGEFENREQEDDADQDGAYSGSDYEVRPEESQDGGGHSVCDDDAPTCIGEPAYPPEESDGNDSGYPDINPGSGDEYEPDPPKYPDGGDDDGYNDAAHSDGGDQRPPYELPETDPPYDEPDDSCGDKYTYAAPNFYGIAPPGSPRFYGIAIPESDGGDDTDDDAGDDAAYPDDRLEEIPDAYDEPDDPCVDKHTDASSKVY